MAEKKFKHVEKKFEFKKAVNLTPQRVGRTGVVFAVSDTKEVSCPSHITISRECLPADIKEFGAVTMTIEGTLTETALVEDKSK